MTRDNVVIALTAVGSAWCWWPVSREQSLEFSRWILLGLIALMALFATLVANRRWLSVVVAATVGSFLGMCASQAMWPSDDGIANSYAGIVIVIATLAVLVLALVGGFNGTSILHNQSNRSACSLDRANGLHRVRGGLDGGDTSVGRSPDSAQGPVSHGKVGGYEERAIDSVRAEADGKARMRRARVKPSLLRANF
ncbi:hypothetical protein [Acidisarcina polymorpha]|uniref:hypothetical protein n=1 Tax=Acidisarcina polymorpha TaxID=2211140 RepID=UPI000DEEF857|nr:hypothetical protein [Acidisarcina polymorpha]